MGERGRRRSRLPREHHGQAMTAEVWFYILLAKTALVVVSLLWGARG